MKWVEQPAIVELFGHQVVAGRITEEEHIGDAFLRVDVPDGSTKFFGAKAVYAITPTDEVTMRLAAESLNYKPVSLYLVAPAPLGYFPEDIAAELRDHPDEPEEGPHNLSPYGA